MCAPALIRHVGGAWGFEHYEAVVVLKDSPTIAAISAAGAHAALAAQADGQNLEEARVLISGGRLVVVVRFSRPGGA